MKKHQIHRPGEPLMPEVCPPVYRSWTELHTARAQALVALHAGLLLAAVGFLTLAAGMVALLSR